MSGVNQDYNGKRKPRSIAELATTSSPSSLSAPPLLETTAVATEQRVHNVDATSSSVPSQQQEQDYVPFSQAVSQSNVEEILRRNREAAEREAAAVASAYGSSEALQTLGSEATGGKNSGGDVEAQLEELNARLAERAEAMAARALGAEGEEVYQGWLSREKYRLEKIEIATRKEREAAEAVQRAHEDHLFAVSTCTSIINDLLGNIDIAADNYRAQAEAERLQRLDDLIVAEALERERARLAALEREEQVRQRLHEAQFSSADPHIAEIRQEALRRLREAEAAQQEEQAEELDDLEAKYKAMMSTNAAKKVRLAQVEAKARGRKNAKLALQLAQRQQQQLERGDPEEHEPVDDDGDVSDLVGLIELGLEEDYSGNKGLRQLLQGIEED